MMRWRPRSGVIRETFAVPSADPGFVFHLDADGVWRTRGRHHAPHEVAVEFVLELVSELAASFSLREPERLQHRANTLLGRPVDLPTDHVRVLWASVQVHADPGDQAYLREVQRRRAQAEGEDSERRRRTQRVIDFRDHLREDPTLALSQMLLETPQHVSSDMLETMESVAERIAAYAPGAAHMALAQLLREFFSDQQPSAKAFIVEQLCNTLVQFGGAAQAKEIRRLFQAEGHPASPVGATHETS